MLGDVDKRSIEEVAADDIAGYDRCHFFAGIAGWGDRPLAVRFQSGEDQLADRLRTASAVRVVHPHGCNSANSITAAWKPASRIMRPLQAA